MATKTKINLNSEQWGKTWLTYLLCWLLNVPLPILAKLRLDCRISVDANPPSSGSKGSSAVDMDWEEDFFKSAKFVPQYMNFIKNLMEFNGIYFFISHQQSSIYSLFLFPFSCWCISSLPVLDIKFLAFKRFTNIYSNLALLIFPI